MLNVPVLRNEAIPDPMTARKLLAKVTAVFHSYIQRAIRHHSCEEWRLSPSEPSRKYQKRLQTFLQKASMQFEFLSMRWLKNTQEHMKH
jgi:hypothetical protein